jgi:hypothetical protein
MATIALGDQRRLPTPIFSATPENPRHTYIAQSICLGIRRDRDVRCFMPDYFITCQVNNDSPIAVLTGQGKNCVEGMRRTNAKRNG